MNLARSYLFVPANRPERYDKACGAGAHAVIVDLEDAVPAADKKAARAELARWLKPERPVLVRVNGADTEWFADDIAMCRTPGVAGIVLSKAERIDHVARAASAAPVLPLIESAIGFDNLSALAAAPRVQRLIFGSIDFKLDLGIIGERDELLYFRSRLVLASRLAQLPAPVDGVSTALDDLALVADDASYARRLGFGAKLCIHPKQVAAVNHAYAPSPQELDWAKRVLAAAQTAHGAAVALDGKMIDRPVILIAQQIIDESQRSPP